MSQRSAHFSSPDGRPEEKGDGAEPTFATSMIGFGGVMVPRGAHPAQ
jgi:hypothetical protein